MKNVVRNSIKMVTYETDRLLREASYKAELGEITEDPQGELYFFDGLTWVFLDFMPEDGIWNGRSKLLLPNASKK